MKQTEQNFMIAAPMRISGVHHTIDERFVQAFLPEGLMFGETRRDRTLPPLGICLRADCGRLIDPA